VEEIGEGLEVTGWAVVDELPEALEDSDRRFALGVQWHPEADETSRLIAALVVEAAAHRAAAAR
jgi:putative glutamine amidotransferase